MTAEPAAPRPPVPLVATAYDRAAHRRTDDAWLAEAWQRARVLLVTPRSSAPTLAGRDGVERVSYCTPAALAEIVADPSAVPRRFLGVVGDDPYFAVTVPPETVLATGSWRSLREIGAGHDDLGEGLFTAAIALEQWHLRHPHCSWCGAATVEANAGWIRKCPEDASQHFPRTDPAIITVIHDGGDRCLLGRNTAWEPGRYSTLAGFVEPGESLEAAVDREIAEEVSVHVADIRYVASQPWPFPSSLMLGFSARVEGDQLIRPDHVEMAEASWFTREQVRAAAARADGEGEPDPDAELQQISPKLSISRYLIDLWLTGDL